MNDEKESIHPLDTKATQLLAEIRDQTFDPWARNKAIEALEALGVKS